jgi:hypothetical protein
MGRARRFLCVILLLLPAPLLADGPAAGAYRPDPAAVQRYGPAYRFPQDGWTVLHIEGEPYERGYQHGRLMPQEIAAHLRCFAAVQGHQAPAEAWQQTRKIANALFLRRFATEFLEEMKGIAAGASAGGGRIFGRPIDLVDIVALNCWPEIETLDPALEALPNGLEGKRFLLDGPRAKPAPRAEHCSAFAATGPAAADGKIVFGHITMFGLYPANFYNVWLDIKPAKGHRVLMCAYPGAMQSGMDYYLNDAGLLIAETTISQTRFNPQGLSEASRIRQAIQYAGSIDAAVAILGKDNNGLYTNEWLLGDVNTNEIALFELGTKASKLHRSSKNEWIGGTTGFYWGCNNTKALELRLETIPSVAGRPANLVFRPSERDQAWQRLYHKHKGKIDVNFAKEAFTTPPIAAFSSLDAKFTTTDMAKNLQSWALFGPPLGRTWQPTLEQRKNYPEIKPLVSNPWTVLHGVAPEREKVLAAADIVNPEATTQQTAVASSKSSPTLLQVPAWHGTLLPQTDADIWLATAFADYERIVATDKARRGDREPTADERDALALDLFAYRSRYRTAVPANGSASAETSLAAVKSETAGDDWYRLASGKGVLVLHELHRLLGDPLFAETMDSFGRDHAGKKISTAQFEAHLKQIAGKQTDGFIEAWVKQSRLPALTLRQLSVTDAAVATDRQNGDAASKHCLIRGEIHRTTSKPPVAKVDVTVETEQGEITKTFDLKGARTEFTIASDSGRPKNIILDKYGQSALAGMRGHALQSYAREQNRTLIAYGTSAELPTNREAAEALQKAIRESGPNFTIPIKSDQQVTEQDLQTHHLLLIGRPDCNSLVKRFEKKLPIAFGHRSFVVRGKTYAHPESAVMAVTANPTNEKLSLVVIAGLEAASTLNAAPQLARHGGRPAEVLLLAHGQPARLLVLAPEQFKE